MSSALPRLSSAPSLYVIVEYARVKGQPRKPSRLVRKWNYWRLLTGNTSALPVSEPPTPPNGNDNFGQSETLQAKQVSAAAPAQPELSLSNPPVQIEEPVVDQPLLFFQAYEAACKWNNGRGLFASFDDKRAGMLACAYRLAVATLLKGDSAFDLLLQHEYFSSRKKRWKRKVTLIAVALVAKPDKPEDFKKCSAYAKYLDRALEMRVDPERFGECMRDVPLRPAASRGTAEASRQARAASESAQPPDGVVTSATLTATLIGDLGLLEGARNAAVMAVVVQRNAAGLTLRIVSRASDEPAALTTE